MIGNQELPGYEETISEDKKVITRIISENAHPVINHQMFVKLAKARFEAARALIQDNIQKTNDEKEREIAELNRIERKNLHLFFDTKFEENFVLAKENRINSSKKSRVEQLEVEKAYHQAFDELYEHNMERLKEVSVLIAHYVDAHKSADKVLKQINNKVNLLNAKKERPIQHNHYNYGEMAVQSSHIPEGELITSQIELYKEVFKEDPPENQLYTNPSTVRDKFQVGQANSICTEIKVNGKRVFKGHRHGSPSVLKIEDEAERQYRTMQNVRETLAVAAKEKLTELNEEYEVLLNKIPLDEKDRARLEQLEGILIKHTIPLPLDLATMSLLSPVADDNPLLIKGLDDPMKQYRQVNDSRLAYWSLDGRKFSLDVPGIKGGLTVQLNSTFMSMGVNAARGIGTLEAQHLVQRVNNRGLNHMTDNFLKALPKGGGVKPITDLLRVIEQDKKIEKYSNKIEKYDKRKLQKAYENLELCNEELHAINERLAFCKKALTDPNEDVSEIKKAQARLKDKKTQLNSDRKKAKKTIDKHEKVLDGHYRNLAIVRKKAYQKELPQLKDGLNKIQERRKDDLKQDKNFQMLRLFVDALDTFYNQPQPGLKRLVQQKRLSSVKNKKEKAFNKETNPYKKALLEQEISQIQESIDALNKGNYRFQARFALLAQHMNAFVEWFCKSGEDRTGLLNEHIEAFCIFIEKYGYAPRWDDPDDSKKFHEIVPHVHNGAPNRETNGANDHSRGLKVTDADFVSSVSYYTDKKMANMAPKSIKIGKEASTLLAQAKERMGTRHVSFAENTTEIPRTFTPMNSSKQNVQNEPSLKNDGDEVKKKKISPN